MEARANWQTRARGTNVDEYQIYGEQATQLGWEVNSYDDWISS